MIFKTFYETNIIADMFAVKHLFFTRTIRWSIIFFDIFLSSLQIMCLLSIAYDPLKVPKDKTIVLFAFERVWVCFVSSFNTQILIFGTCFLLRFRETRIMNVGQYENYEHWEKNLKKTRRCRFLIFTGFFLTVLFTLYGYAVYFCLNHSNDIALVWMFLGLL